MNINKIKLLFWILCSIVIMSYSFAHESLLLDLQENYQAEVRWGDFVEPKLSLVIMLEAKDFDEEIALKKASQYLREFTSHYEKIFFIFSDLSTLSFMPPKRYGLELTTQNNQDKNTIVLLSDTSLNLAVKSLRNSEELRKTSENQEAHFHSEN